jgi:squalene-associated FAD-dependent desaturase
MKRVAVIGAGWSGLACALELTRRGFGVTLLDAAPQVGGRARAVGVRLGDREFTLDNGQHLLIGAYSECLRLMAEVGVDVDVALLRLPLEVRYPDAVRLRASPWPAPLHLLGGLLGARGFDWAVRRHVIGFVLRWQRRQWRIDDDAPASALFTDAPAPAVRRIWRPLCLAALNVELEDASAQVLLTVLRDSIAGGSRAADFLIPRQDLSAIFAAPAARALTTRGAEVELRAVVQGLGRTGDRWRIAGRSPAEADAVVLALPPGRAADLLQTAQRPELDAAIATLASIRTAPIVTVYLRYPPSLQLDRPACTLLDDADRGRYGQWVFDRGRLDAAQAGILSVVVSAAEKALGVESKSVADTVAAQLSADLALPPPLATAVLAEKRATIVPAPGLARPPVRLPVAGLYLAGDAAASEYPSTLEGSVRAGIAAAHAVAADLRPH